MGRYVAPFFAGVPTAPATADSSVTCGNVAQLAASVYLDLSWPCSYRTRLALERGQAANFRRLHRCEKARFGAAGHFMAEGSFKPPSDEASMLRQWSSMAGLGVEFISAIVLLGAVGYAIDRHYGSQPWGMLVGGGLGFAIGLMRLVQAGNRAMKKRQK
jgi:F0F1-type ATP synthase assembly protein I